MILTILAEDTCDPSLPDLDSDHGFSLHADTGKLKILYDFGGKDSLRNNSGKLGIDLADVDTAILSHGHHDHSDGLDAFLKANDTAVVHHGRGAFHPRWSISKGSPRDVGISMIPMDDVVERLNVVDSLVDKETYVILPAAPGHRGRPGGNAKLLAGPEGNRLQDDFTDELTLVLRTDRGLIVVTGCSHRGILNIVDQVKTYCPKCPIRALIGGFHLIDSEESEETLRDIGKRLNKDLSETRIITGHCTGKNAIGIMEETMGRPIESLHAGLKLNF